MSQQIIDTSTATDTLAAGFAKVNNNFTELYSSLVSTGMMVDYWGLYEPDGWVFAAGGTIGNAGSGADYTDGTEGLFVLLWNSIGDSYCPVSGGRIGPNAVDDFNAGKTLTLPDARGKTSIFAGGSFAVLGSSAGSETVSLVADNMPTHSHDVVIPAHNHSINVPTSSVAVQNGSDSDVFLSSTSQNTSSTTDETVTSSSEGSGSSFSIMQPSIVCHKIIKL